MLPLQWLPLTLLALLAPPTSGEVIDLSHAHTPDSFAFVSRYSRSTEYEDLDLGGGVIITSSMLHLPEHSGTHMDAPLHFFGDGKNLEEIPVEWTIKEGVTVDCRREAAMDRQYLVTTQKLQEWEQANGRIPQGAAVLFDFGWSDKFMDKEEYVGSQNLSDTFSFVHPSVSPEAGAWLYSERNTAIIGVDTLSPDPIPALTFDNHLLYLGNDRLLVENLKIPAHMPARGFRFHATPPKYRGASGIQVRAFAMTHDDSHVADGACAAQVTLTLVMFTAISGAVWSRF